MVLLGHLPRRAIVMDPVDRIPTLVDSDEPYHIFRQAVAQAGLHVRVLSDGKEAAAEGGDEQKQRPLLLAFALDPEQLQRLPAGGPL